MEIKVNVALKGLDVESMQVAIEEIIGRLQRLNTEEITPEQALAILKSYKSLL
jgi:hypothetical protein